MKKRKLVKIIIGNNFPLIVLYVAIALFIQLLNVFNMEYMRNLLNDVIDLNSVLSRNILIIFFLVTLIVCSNYATNFFYCLVEKRVLTNIQFFLYEKNLSIKDYENTKLSKTRRFTVAEEDSKKIVEEVMSNINIIVDFISVPIYIIYSCIVNVHICVLTIVVSLLLSFINIKYSRNLNRSTEAYYDVWDKWSLFLYKSLGMTKIIRLFLSQNKINKKIEEDNITLNKYEVENLKSYLDMVKIKESFEIFYSTFIVAFSFLLLFFSKLKISDLIIIIQLTSLLQGKLFDIPVNISSLLKFKSCISNVDEIMVQKDLTDDSKISFPVNEIKINGLSVSYDGKKVLNGFDCTFTAGNFYWLIGESGSGKTTILKSICNLNVHEGSVCFDGKIVDDIKPLVSKIR